jgi:hypothetical protein
MVWFPLQSGGDTDCGACSHNRQLECHHHAWFLSDSGKATAVRANIVPYGTMFILP